MLKDKSFNEFYAILDDIVNPRFNIEENNKGLVNCKEDFMTHAWKILVKGNAQKKAKI